MIRGRSRFVAVAGAAVVFVSACSSSMSVDDYADEMAAITEAYVVESQNLSYDYQSGVEDEVREIVASGSDTAGDDVVILVRTRTAAYLATLLDAMSRFHDDVSELDPPRSVADAHADYVEAIAFVRDAIVPTKQAVEASDGLEGIQVAMSGTAFADGQPRWTAMCLALEQEVRDEGRGVNLRCVRTETPTVGAAP